MFEPRPEWSARVKEEGGSGHPAGALTCSTWRTRRMRLRLTPAAEGRFRQEGGRQEGICREGGREAPPSLRRRRRARRGKPDVAGEGVMRIRGVKMAQGRARESTLLWHLGVRFELNVRLRSRFVAAALPRPCPRRRRCANQPKPPPPRLQPHRPYSAGSWLASTPAPGVERPTQLGTPVLPGCGRWGAQQPAQTSRQHALRRD